MNARIITNRRLARWLSLFVVAALPLTWLAAQEAAAPKYKEQPIKTEWDERVKDPTKKSAASVALRDRKILVNQVLKNDEGKSLQNHQEAFDEFYQQYLFPRWTWSASIEDVKLYNFLAKERINFVKDHLKKPKLANVHDHLVDITFNAMSEFIKPDYHPATRYNAMLLIAELNAVEVKTEGTAIAHEPLPKALPILVTELEKLVTDLDAGGPFHPMSVAAMVGVLRHVTADNWQPPSSTKRIAPDVKNKINGLCLRLVNRKGPVDERIKDGVVWVQRRAIEILGALGTLETDVQVAKAMDIIVGDEKSPLSLRCSAADALGQLNKPKETELKPADTARKLGDLAVFAIKQELQRLDDEKKHAEEKAKFGRGGSGGGGGGGGPAAGAGPGAAGAGAPGAAGAPGLGNDSGAGAAGAAGIAGAPGMRPGGGFPGGGIPGAAGKGAGPNKVATDKYQLDRTKRFLKSAITPVAIGFDGPPKSKATNPKPKLAAAGAPADAPPEVADAAETSKQKGSGILGMIRESKNADEIKHAEAVSGKVEEIRDMIDDPSLDDLEDLVKKVRGMLAELEKVNQSLAGNAIPGQVDEDDDLNAPKKPIKAAANPDPSAPAVAAAGGAASNPAIPPAADDAAKKGEN